MARKQKQIVETQISEEIAENHPEILEGNLSDAQKTRLEKYQTQITEQNLMKDDVPLAAANLYNSCYAELVGKAVKSNIEELALNQVGNAIRKAIKAKDYVPKNTAKVIVGFKIADSGLFDKISIARNKARKVVEKEGRQAAIDQHLINEKGEVLDQREKLFGKENSNYRKPLKDTVKDMSRTLDIITIKIDGNEKKLITSLQGNEPKIVRGWDNVPSFKLFTTYANVKGEAKEEGEAEDITLSVSLAEDTMTQFKALNDETVDVNQTFLDMVEPLLTRMADLEAEHGLVAKDDKCPFNKRFFVRGVITYVGDRKDGLGRITIGLMDKEDNCSEIKVKVPDYVALEGGEGSEVIVIGKTERMQKNEDGKWVNGDIGMGAFGIWFDPNMSAPTQESSDEPLSEEEPVQAWVD